MSARTSQGFTIIETMLFLAITGMLIIGVMIGVGASIDRQRYKDAVASFKDLIQSQYADLGSVMNDRTNTWTCDANAATTTGGTTIRGQSNCFLVGKYLRIEKGDIDTYTILATERPSMVTTGTDISRLDVNYIYNSSKVSTQKNAMEWGTQIAWPKTGSGSQSPQTPRSLGILFIRSPETGNIYTFTSDTVPLKTAVTHGTITSIINASTTTSPGQGAKTICILSSGMITTGDESIFISPYAASASAIEGQTNDYMQTQGVTTRC